MNLEYEQRMWLSKMLHHDHKGAWLTWNEEDIVRLVLDAGRYDDKQKLVLQEIRTYYINYIKDFGTLDNPK